MLDDSFEFDCFFDDQNGFDDSATTTSEDLSISDFNSLEDPLDYRQVVCKPKKKRVRVRKTWPVAPGPKIIKNDIRRSYSNMIVNVLNSCDIHLLYGMLDTFFVPNFLQSFRKTINGDVCAEQAVVVHGLQDAAQYWFTCIALVPDLVVQLGNTEIQYHNGKIVSSINMSATKLYDDSLSLASTGESVSDEMKQMKLTEKKGKLRKLMNNSSSSSSSSAVNDVSRIMSSVEKIVNGLVLRETPEVFSAVGTFVLHTDNDKRITGMEWVANSTY